MDVTAALIRILRLTYGVATVGGVISANILQFVVLAALATFAGTCFFLTGQAVDYLSDFGNYSYGIFSSLLYFCGIDIIITDTIFFLDLFLGLFVGVVFVVALKFGWICFRRADEAVHETVSKTSGGAVC